MMFGSMIETTGETEREKNMSRKVEEIVWRIEGGA